MSGKLKEVAGLGVFLQSNPDVPFLSFTCTESSEVRRFADMLLSESYIIKRIIIQWIE